jgi:hypothetical protein
MTKLGGIHERGLVCPKCGRDRGVVKGAHGGIACWACGYDDRPRCPNCESLLYRKKDGSYTCYHCKEGNPNWKPHGVVSFYCDRCKQVGYPVYGRKDGTRRCSACHYDSRTNDYRIRLTSDLFKPRRTETIRGSTRDEMWSNYHKRLDEVKILEVVEERAGGVA